MSWRRLFPAIFVFSLVHGFISNWLYAARLSLLYRDIFLLGVYLLFISQEPVGRWVRLLRERIGQIPWLLFLSFMLVGMVQIFNPLLPAMLVGLLGFKVLFFYCPLAVLAFAYADNLDRARALFKPIVYLSAPINLFGLYQFWKGPEFLITTFGPGFERAIIMAHIEGATRKEETFLRVFGTFASSGEFSSFLIANGMLSFALLFSSRTKFERLMFSGCALLNFPTMLATGSRGGLITLILAALILGVLCSNTQWRLVIALVVASSLYLGFGWLGHHVVVRFLSLRDLDMVHQRTLETTPAMFTDLVRDYPLGRGLGAGSAASRHVLGDDSTEWELVENDPSKLQLETGILGVILFYCFVITLSLRWIRKWHKPLDRATFEFVAPLAAYCLPRLWLSFVVGGFDSAPGAVFFWAFVGIVARLSARSILSKQTAFAISESRASGIA